MPRGWSIDNCSAIARCKDRCKNGFTAPSSGAKSWSRLRCGSSSSPWYSGWSRMMSIAVRSRPSSGARAQYLRQVSKKKRRASARVGLNMGRGGFRLGLELAQVTNQAGRARGTRSLANVAPMQDEPVVRVAAEFLGHEFQQALFHLDHVGSGRDAGAIGDAEDVRIHRDRVLAERGIQNDVRGFAPDSGEAFEIVPVRWHFATEFFQQQRAGCEDIFGFRAVQADTLYVRRQSGFAEREDGLRRARRSKQPGGGKVHAPVGGLRRQDDRDQQFERRLVDEFGRRRRIGGAKAPENFRALVRVHGLLNRARRARACSMAACTSALLRARS